jgi:hypothetical protein
MAFGSDVGPGSWMDAAGIVFVVLLLLAWLFMAANLALRGDTVEKPNRIPQFYGFTVCLLAIVVGLITISSIIGAMFDRANPLDSTSSFGESLTSFNAYKASVVNRGIGIQRINRDSTRAVSDSGLRVLYGARVSDRLAHVRYDTSKSLVTNALLLLVAIVLFVLHWRWLRRMNGAAPA